MYVPESCTKSQMESRCSIRQLDSCQEQLNTAAIAMYKLPVSRDTN